MKHFSLRDTETDEHIGTIVVDETTPNAMDIVKAKLEEACSEHMDGEATITNINDDVMRQPTSSDVVLSLIVDDEEYTRNVEISRSWLY